MFMLQLTVETMVVVEMMMMVVVEMMMMVVVGMMMVVAENIMKEVKKAAMKELKNLKNVMTLERSVTDSAVRVAAEHYGYLRRVSASIRGMNDGLRFLDRGDLGAAAGGCARRADPTWPDPDGM